MLSNNIRFQPRLFGSDAVVEESTIRWIPIDTQNQQSLPFKVQTSRINLQDHFVNFDSLTELENDKVFSLVEMRQRPAQWDDDIIMNISFELSLDLLIVLRDGYTIIDIISDLGGINAVCMVVFPMIINLFKGQSLDKYLVSKLYLDQEENKGKRKSKCCFKIIEYFKAYNTKRIKFKNK